MDGDRGEDNGDGGGAEAVRRTALETVIAFSRALHEAGMAVTPGNLIDLGRCFDHVAITARDDFHAACRATLVSRREDIARFEAVFARFWEAPEHLHIRKNKPGNDEDEASGDSGAEARVMVESESGDGAGGDTPRPSFDLSYSADEVLAVRDLGTFTDADIERARRLIRDLVAALANARGRRYAARASGRRVALRRLLRNRSATLADGICRLPYAAARINKTRLVLLCDVSGSMQRYSAFLIEFIYALRRELSNLEVGVFSTQLTMITDLLRAKGVAGSLRHVAGRVQDWAGGTTIGSCLGTFNERHAPHLIKRRSVVILLSDGWDCGPPDELQREMTRLRRRAGTLIWLNPLLGTAGYRPLTQGMRTALPFLDHFLPAHNLQSLSQLVRTLQG